MGTSQATPGTTLRIQRTIGAPREKVFAAWTQPEAVKQWFGVEGYATPSAEIDLRPGGRYRLEIKKLADGTLSFLSGTFQDVLVPERLVYTWRWENQPDFPDTLVTVEFNDRGNSTELLLTHELLPNQKAREEHNLGWNSCFDRLARYLSRQA